MKYALAFVLIISMFLVISCSNGNDTASKSFSDKKDVQAMLDKLSGTGENSAQKKTSDDLFVVYSQPSRKADIDLTDMSSSVAYSMAIDMSSYPLSYIGKTVKMSGQFATMTDPDTEKRYYACRIQDATACCGQAIEFEPKGNYSYPDDFPIPGMDVSVLGVFDIYEEEGYTYCTLRNAELLK